MWAAGRQAGSPGHARSERRFYPHVNPPEGGCCVKLIWCAAFGIAGHALGTHWDAVHHAFRYADYAAVAALAAAVAVAVVRLRRSIAA